MTTSTDKQDTVKAILKAGDALLRPPAGLPIGEVELRERVEGSWNAWPVVWDEGLVGVARDPGGLQGLERGDEADRMIGKMAELSTDDGEHGDGPRAGLLVGLRCLDLLVGLQRILVREFWPAGARGGDARDFILGTADLRLIRLLLTHSIDLLSTLSDQYLTSLHTSSMPSAAPVRAVLLALLSLLRPTPPPPTPSPGPSSTPSRPLPPTTISQLLITSHLPPILLSAILVGYNPTALPSVHADIRQGFLSTLSSLPPAQALLALSGVLTLFNSRRSPILGTASISEHLPLPPYPSYISSITHRQLSAQLLRPTGVRGLLLNIFGERALSDAESVPETKVGHAIEVLRRVPGGVDEAVYVRHVTKECLEMLGLPRVGKGAPRAFKSVAAGVVGRWLDKWDMAEVLGEAFEVLSTAEGEKEEGRLRALTLLDTLIGYTDPAHLPRLLDIAVRPLLPSLRLFAPAEPPSGDSSDRSETAEKIGELAQEVLETWERVHAPIKP